jgi:hypothetical protein
MIGSAKLVASHKFLPFYTFFDGSGDNAPNPEDPAIKALIEAAVANATSGLITNRDAALKEKKELKAQLDSMQQQWGGLDPAMVKNLINRMQNDEETKLIAEGKVDEVISRRVTSMQKDFEAKLAAATAKLTEYEGHVKQRDGRIKDLVIDGSIRETAAKLGLVPHALEDAVTRAKGRFVVGDDGKAVARDDNGTLVMGKDGKTPMGVSEWLEGMKEQAPHWFPAPSGAGAAGGGSGRKAGGVVITKSDASDARKYQAAREQAAKAGVTVQIVDG